MERKLEKIQELNKKTVAAVLSKKTNDALIMRIYSLQQNLNEALRERGEVLRYYNESCRIIDEALGTDFVECGEDGVMRAEHYAASIKKLKKQRDMTAADVGERVIEGLKSGGRPKSDDDGIRAALEALSGDFSYDKLAQAKEILEGLISSASISLCPICRCDCPGCGCRSGCCTKCGCCNS